MDLRITRLQSALAGRAHRRAERQPDHREAAVALVLRPREELEILLIRRAEMAGDPWSGHVALPGGKRAAADADLFATACRETEEEVGIALERVGSLIGPLDEVAPATPRLPRIVIAPYVLVVPPDTHATPDPREVQAALWVPVRALRDPGAISEIAVEMPGARHSFPSRVYEDYVVWGLTLRILEQLFDELGLP